MADLNIVKFSKDEEAEHHNSKVIRLLEEALEHAKNESSTSLALTMICGDGNVIDCYHNGGRPYVMVGAIEALKTDFIHGHIQGRYDG